MIESIATAQLGLATRAQLLEAGLPPSAVKSGVRAQYLRPLHRGVYQVGPVTAPHSRELAAVLACGAGAVLSHRSAAALWRMIPGQPASAPVDVTVVGRNSGRRPGIRVHRCSELDPGSVTRLHGVPITAPTRTLLDIAHQVDLHELEQALGRAERERLVTRAELSSTAFRGRAGARALGALLRAGLSFTRSEAERKVLALVKRARLPLPETNVRVEDYEVDFLWRAQRLVVEVDGFAFHGSRTAFEHDRRRDARLAAADIQVIRVTWSDIVAGREAFVAVLAQTLARRGDRSL